MLGILFAFPESVIPAVGSVLLAKAYCETDRQVAAHPKLSEIAKVSATAVKSCALLHGLGKTSVGTELAGWWLMGSFRWIESRLTLCQTFVIGFLRPPVRR